VGDNIPLAYLITFRCYGTWLHGDERGSVDRFHNRYGAPNFPPNDARQRQNSRKLKQAPVVLNPDQRESVGQAIRETCDVRRWLLRAVNVRTNHVHAIVSTDVRPELALNALKTMPRVNCDRMDIGSTRAVPRRMEGAEGISGPNWDWNEPSTM
jgi:hypothetical protein